VSFDFQYVSDSLWNLKSVNLNGLQVGTASVEPSTLTLES
jgi:hypothetical protein